MLLILHCNKTVLPPKLGSNTAEFSLITKAIGLLDHMKTGSRGLKRPPSDVPDKFKIKKGASTILAKKDCEKAVLKINRTMIHL